MHSRHTVAIWLTWLVDGKSHKAYVVYHFTLTNTTNTFILCVGDIWLPFHTHPSPIFSSSGIIMQGKMAASNPKISISYSSLSYNYNAASYLFALETTLINQFEHPALSPEKASA